MRAITATLLVLFAGAASAHPSVTEHVHPHGASWLLGIDVIIGAAMVLALAAGGVALARRRR